MIRIRGTRTKLGAYIRPLLPLDGDITADVDHRAWRGVGTHIAWGLGSQRRKLQSTESDLAFDECLGREENIEFREF